MNIAFNPANPRVKLAKQKRFYHTTPAAVIAILLFLGFITSGLVLLFLKNPLGWLPLTCAIYPMIFLYWSKTALASIPPKQSEDFTDLIDEELLLLLSPNLTPADLPPIFEKTKSARFIMVRFEIPSNLLTALAATYPTTIHDIYAKALELRTQTNSTRITAGLLLVAFLILANLSEDILAKIQLSPSDLEEGVIWYNYLAGLVEDNKKPRDTGGIARDLSFGYTPTLQRFAVNLSLRYGGLTNKVQQSENTEILDKMFHIFSHPGRENVALVGAYGSGRSTIVNSFAERLMTGDTKVPASLKYRQIYALDVSSLISATKDRGELEYLMNKILNEVYSAKNIILCLDHAHLFFEEGPGSIDISNLLAPVLESGAIRIILEIDDQRFLEISRKNPHLASTLNKITVHPSTPEETLKILMDIAPFLEQQKDVSFTYRALTEACRLSNEYIHDIAMPGCAKLLLESAASYAEHQLVTATSVQTAIEKSYGVKIQIANTTTERDKLLNLESLIHERMVDQTPAVASVANALRRAAAGVKNRNRPIGTFLFLGPTGVGKTELAKSLSQVYFGSEEDIIRLDLNEFVESSDVSRLIADGAKDEGSLTAQIIKRPFSVVLLDEIEKAHPAVLTTLLQVLDEGILRDEKNREVSFRDAIIIATSNAGATAIRETVKSHTDLTTIKDQLVDTLIKDNVFKPEFLNRFDEICLFKPLEPSDLEQILDLILASINRTLATQKITVTLTQDAKNLLITHGYNPEMGARPLRRLVQTTVENFVASAILSGTATPGAHLTLTPAELNLS